MARANKKADTVYKNAYQRQNYWRPTVLIAKDLEEKVRAAANGNVNGYINNLIQKDLEGK